MEELAVAEQRAASAERARPRPDSRLATELTQALARFQDMWAVMEREAKLRRKINEHYASTLAWEARRLQLLTHSTSTAPGPSSDSKGKQRETELSLEIDRLTSRVQELEGLVGDAGDRHTTVADEVQRLRRDLEQEQLHAREDREDSERRAEDLMRQVQEHETARSLAPDVSDLNLDAARALLVPLLGATTALPPDDAPFDVVAESVREEFEVLERRIDEGKAESKAVREGLESELARLALDRDAAQRASAMEKRQWSEEKIRLQMEL